MSSKTTNEGLTMKMDLLIVQMTKITVLEERHGSHQADLLRANTRIDENAKKFESLAEESKAFMNFTKGQNKVLWLISTVVAALCIKALFFAANHGMTP